MRVVSASDTKDITVISGCEAYRDADDDMQNTNIFSSKERIIINWLGISFLVALVVWAKCGLYGGNILLIRGGMTTDVF